MQTPKELADSLPDIRAISPEKQAQIAACYFVAQQAIALSAAIAMDTASMHDLAFLEAMSPLLPDTWECKRDIVQWQEVIFGENVEAKSVIERMVERSPTPLKMYQPVDVEARTKALMLLAECESAAKYYEEQWKANNISVTDVIVLRQKMNDLEALLHF